MGKASKWIRKLFMGKTEDEEDKKKLKMILPESSKPVAMVVQAIPADKIKRRWSFKRSGSTKPTMHKSSKSVDNSILMPKQALFEYEIQEQNIVLLQNVHAAATKIQAAYRSYLAQRALRALRGLVKIQALARGHLVRKQMTAVLRSMHAVMAIQVRARIHRVQMADEPSVAAAYLRKEICVKYLLIDLFSRFQISMPSLSSPQANNFGLSCFSDPYFNHHYLPLLQEDRCEGNIHQTRGSLRSRSERIDHKPTERVEYGYGGYVSGRHSVSQAEYHQQQIHPSPSTQSFTDSTSTTNDWQINEFSLKMAQGISKLQSLRHQKNQPYAKNPHALCPDHIDCKSSFQPNYMTNTKSSQAKARSQSEPRQRPKFGRKQKSRRSESMDGNSDKEHECPWLIKPYRSDKFTNDVDFGSGGSILSSVSHPRNSLIQFEPPECLY